MYSGMARGLQKTHQPSMADVVHLTSKIRSCGDIINVNKNL